MAETQNLKLYVTPIGDIDTNTIDWLQKIAGESSTSNMAVIDKAIGDLQEKVSAPEVYSADEPVGQVVGEVWNKILPAGG